MLPVAVAAKATDAPRKPAWVVATGTVGTVSTGTVLTVTVAVPVRVAPVQLPSDTPVRV